MLFALPSAFGLGLGSLVPTDHLNPTQPLDRSTARFKKLTRRELWDDTRTSDRKLPFALGFGCVGLGNINGAVAFVFACIPLDSRRSGRGRDGFPE